MKIQLLPSRFDADVQLQLLTTFLVNDCLAVDAGSLGFALSADQRERVRHVLITHAHMDHIASLPTFIEEEFGSLNSPVIVYAIPEVVAALRQFIFNNQIWPDFERIPRIDQGGPALEFRAIEAGVRTEIAGVHITAFPVNHTVPAAGMLLEEESAAVIYGADTYATDRLWKVANDTRQLKAIFVDISYPNELEQLAFMTGHLTPQSLASELQKLKREAEIHCVHIKPRYRDQVVQQLKALHDPRISIAEIGRLYEW